MKKTLRRLEPKVTLQSDFFVLDVETGIRRTNYIQYELCARPEKFIFGVIYGKNYTKVCHTIEEMKLTLLEPRFKKKKVFAHNAEYDLTTIYGNIFDLDSEAIFNGRFICANNGNCLFADSMNLLKTSVKELGKLIGKSKDLLGDNNLKSYDFAKDVNYCIRDCEIVFDALYQLFEETGNIKITQASLSLDYFRRFHLNFDIHHNPDMTKNFYDSYFGGRTEMFKKGKCHAYVYDVNSMYPYIMKTSKFPNPLYLRHETFIKTDRFIMDILPNYEGMVTCQIEHKDSYIGFLPVKKDGKLLFPIGTFSGSWNFNEIRFALEKGVINIIKIKKVVYSKAIESPFINFIDTLYKQRMKTDSEFEKFRIKILMNSLYGKMGQRNLYKNEYISNISKSIEYINQLRTEKKLIKIQMFSAERNDCFLIIKGRGENDFSIPTFASYITSEARVLLLKKLLEVQNKGILYCDTDSIFIENDSGLINSPLLGQWKKENKIVTEIRGLKNYSYVNENNEPKHNIKGVPKKAIQTGTNKYEYETLIKTKEALRQNKEPGTLTKKVKVLTGKYDKRILLTDNQTKPIKIC